MKKYLILISLLSTIFSCNTETTPQIKPSSNSLLKDVIPNNPKSQESNTPIKIIKTTDPTPSSTEKPDFSKLDVYGEGIYCEDRNKIVKAGVVGIKLDKPVNIAVTKDGSAVYVVNGKCGRKPYLRHISEYHDISDLCLSAEKQDVNSDVVENNLIIKITKDGKKQSVIGDNTGIFFCSNDGVIALDENDNLYFSANRRIYKVKDDKYVELVANLDELEKGVESFYQNGMIGGLAVKNGVIYVDVRDIDPPKRIIPTGESHYCIGFCGEGNSSNTLGETKEIKNNAIKNLFLSLNRSRKSNFTLNKNIIFTLNPIIKEVNYINYDKNLFDYEANFTSTKERYIESLNEVAELNLDTNIWNAPYGYNNLAYINSSLVTSILVNSKNEFIFSYGNGILKFIDNKSRIPDLFVGSEEFSNSSSYGYKDGKGNEALFNKPAGMAIDANDNIYVADTGNNAIRKITPDGIVSTFYKE